MGTPANRLTLRRSSCSRHAIWASGDMVSLRLPHEGRRVLASFPEKDSPRCSDRAGGKEKHTIIEKRSIFSGLQRGRREKKEKKHTHVCVMCEKRGHVRQVRATLVFASTPRFSEGAEEKKMYTDYK